MRNFKMLKKFKKTQNIKFYHPDTELEGHIFAFGRIGAGKSVSLKSILEGFMENRGYKIFDLYGGERSEGLYWAIPSQDHEYWERMKILGNFDEEGPKQYDVTFLYPYFESKLPKKLPKKGTYVRSKVFTIPIKDISIEDIRMVLGNLSETNKYYWDAIINKLKNKDNKE